MATRRTIDHEEIRSWVEKHGGHPAIISGAANEEGDDILTFVWGNDGPDTRPVTWREFFGIFDSRNLRFRYEDPIPDGGDAGWAYSFENRREPLDTSDETELPEDADDVDENIFPSAP